MSSLVFYICVVIFSLEMFCALEVTNLHYWRIIVSALSYVLFIASRYFNMTVIMLPVENRPPVAFNTKLL